MYLESEKKRAKVIDFIIAVITLLSILFASAYLEAQEVQPRLILLQSCIGEAGWKAHETTEDIALMHLYKKRTEIVQKWSLPKMVRKYSSAVKKYPKKPNKWINYINLDCSQPKKFWLKKMDWKVFENDCKATLKNVDLFLAGKTVDPIPEAIHFGSPIDLPPASFKRLKVPKGYKNHWYKLRKKK